MNNANKYHSYCKTHCYLTIVKILFFGEKSLLFFLKNYSFLNDEYSKSSSRVGSSDIDHSHSPAGQQLFYESCQ